MREQGQEEDMADASARRQMDNPLSMDSALSTVPDAAAGTAVALAGVLRESFQLIRKKKRLSSSAMCCRQDWI